ncbi:low molecular weight protein-tyrosine-phosphatase [uncultured Phascolarctobacterium sp.]|uniref:low molecular weight protein-tyrosine-phosphatase n=1 Tax=uncultured Phascolarctobacterium sp. TaxID=512296 RepID=UPI0025E4E569|nr:low molecular weight protein-tyrosine-phosphatase [uncultured Phascolarctobacterium sp.]
MKRTHRIMFVCHGNICRSPMAEFLLKDMVKKEGLADRFVIASAGTSREELGNPVHQGTLKKLAQDHISAAGKQAVQLSKEDYDKYDLILGMERVNIRNILRIIGSDPQEKVHRLLDFTEQPRDIADPWYTGDFDIAYAEIKAGCAALLKHLRRF